MTSQVVDALETGRDAASRQAWRDAYDAFKRADSDGLTPSDLASFAEAAWWSGKLEEAIDLRERATITGGRHERKVVRPVRHRESGGERSPRLSLSLPDCLQKSLKNLEQLLTSQAGIQRRGGPAQMQALRSDLRLPVQGRTRLFLAA